MRGCLDRMRHPLAAMHVRDANLRRPGRSPSETREQGNPGYGGAGRERFGRRPIAAVDDEMDRDQIATPFDVGQRNRHHVSDLTDAQLACDAAALGHELLEGVPRMRAHRFFVGGPDRECRDRQVEPRQLSERSVQGGTVDFFGQGSVRQQRQQHARPERRLLAPQQLARVVQGQRRIGAVGEPIRHHLAFEGVDGLAGGRAAHREQSLRAAIEEQDVEPDVRGQALEDSAGEVAFRRQARRPDAARAVDHEQDAGGRSGWSGRATTYIERDAAFGRRQRRQARASRPATPPHRRWRHRGVPRRSPSRRGSMLGLPRPRS